MFKSSWSSPSNIAVIKYWGKYGLQLPRNPSLSFTLSASVSQTTVTCIPNIGKSNHVNIEFYLDKEPNEKFGSRISKWLDTLTVEFPFLKDYTLHIETSNTFPHSSGIASSASGLSALALCLCDLQEQISGIVVEKLEFYKRASMIARLGSGSASRSVFPFMSEWGFSPDVLSSSDEYAIAIEPSDVFKTYHDAILIVNPKEKSVSSSVGHSLMEGNPFAEARYKQANDHLALLLNAMDKSDVHAFGKLAEQEALTLHALMMCSDPSFILMKGNTLLMIDKIRSFRKDTSIPAYFTLDAGPNVHLLYPQEYSSEVHQFIETELRSLCHDGFIIWDKVGSGPSRL